MPRAARLPPDRCAGPGAAGHVDPRVVGSHAREELTLFRVWAPSPWSPLTASA